jgi:isochorismate synthase
LETFIEEQNIHLENSDQDSTTFNVFSNEVLFIQKEISLGNFEKIVASRVNVDFVDYDKSKVSNWFRNLIDEHQSALVSLVYTPTFGFWIGASPETLIQLEDNELTTMSLAGTLTKENDHWTNKEKLEQSVTTKFILEIFNKLDLLAPLDTGIIESKSGKLRHLQSVFKVEINPDYISQILMEFSPTPAVGGYPKEKAVEWINKEEDFQRELFTGFWGPKYNTTLKLDVNLRCAKITQNKQLFYAGCGINLGSDVLNEWNETSAKMKVTSDFRD